MCIKYKQKNTKKYYKDEEEDKRTENEEYYRDEKGRLNKFNEIYSNLPHTKDENAKKEEICWRINTLIHSLIDRLKKKSILILYMCVCVRTCLLASVELCSNEGIIMSGKYAKSLCHCERVKREYKQQQ